MYGEKPSEREAKVQVFEPNMKDYEEEYKNFVLEVPEYYNFGVDAIDAWAAKDPAKTALQYIDQSWHEQHLSFQDLSVFSDNAAGQLLDLGVRKGDRIFLFLPRIPEWWILVIACIKIGAVFCPGPILLTGKDLRFRLNTAHINVVITTTEHAPKFDAIRVECPHTLRFCLVDGERRDWFSIHTDVVRPADKSLPEMLSTKSSDPLVIYFTSGTTGPPKMVLHTQDLALGHITTGALWLDIHPADIHFTLSDTGWAKSSWGKLFGPLLQGACSLVYDFRGKFKPQELLPLIERCKISTLCLPPTAYRMLVREDFTRYNLSSLRHCASAGEPLNPEVMRLWREKTGLRIYEGYGQTETVCCIATFPCMTVKPGSMGKPSPGWHIELHDDDGKPVPAGEDGNIAIRLDPRPAGLFSGYLENEEANREAFIGGFYHTGDRAYCDEDGYYWFVGRSDDIIKSSGYRIGPFEVESALLEHPAVKESAVVGSPDPVRGMIVKAIVVLNPGFDASNALILELQEHVKRSTAPYKYPRKIEFIDKLPKTHSGKIKRHLLRDRELERTHKTDQ